MSRGDGLGRGEGEGEEEKGGKISPTPELPRVLHGDLLSVVDAARQGRGFWKRRNGGIKKPSVFRREETKAGRSNQHRRDSTPILSLARQSPGPHGPGLDERKKAGLLTSGSSYWLRLTARLRAVASWSFRRPLQRRYRTGFTPVSLFSPGLRPEALSGGLVPRERDAVKELGYN